MRVEADAQRVPARSRSARPPCRRPPPPPAPSARPRPLVRSDVAYREASVGRPPAGVRQDVPSTPGSVAAAVIATALGPMSKLHVPSWARPSGTGVPKAGRRTTSAGAPPSGTFRLRLALGDHHAAAIPVARPARSAPEASALVLHHVGIQTNDLANSVDWYQSFFGCEPRVDAVRFLRAHAASAPRHPRSPSSPSPICGSTCSNDRTHD